MDLSTYINQLISRLASGDEPRRAYAVTCMLDKGDLNEQQVQDVARHFLSENSLRVQCGLGQLLVDNYRRVSEEVALELDKARLDRLLSGRADELAESALALFALRNPGTDNFLRWWGEPLPEIEDGPESEGGVVNALRSFFRILQPSQIRYVAAGNVPLRESSSGQEGYLVEMPEGWTLNVSLADDKMLVYMLGPIESVGQVFDTWIVAGAGEAMQLKSQATAKSFQGQAIIRFVAIAYDDRSEKETKLEPDTLKIADFQDLVSAYESTDAQAVIALRSLE